jgi:hypothetical protein
MCGSKAISPAVRWLLRSILTGALLACALLVGSVGVAGASTTYDLRGEWVFELECECTFPVINSKKLPGRALISQMNLTTGAFFGTTNVFEYDGEFKDGVVTGNKVSMTLESQTPDGPIEFVMPEGTIAPGGKEFSGPGKYDPSMPTTVNGAFYAREVRSYQEIEKEEQEQKELAEKRAEERIAEEAREKVEREAKQAAEQEAKEKAEAKAAQEVKEATQQASERSAREAKEKTEREAREAAERAAVQASLHEPLVNEPVAPVGRTFTVVGPGLLSLKLSNANSYSVSGALTLAPAAVTRSSHAPHKGKSNQSKAKPAMLAEATFVISSRGTKLVKLKLSRSVAAELAHRKTLPVVATVTTRAGGTASTKSYGITLIASVKRR